MSGALYLVGTPIGNLSDFSPRALDALRECDFIAAEDTRVTVKLLNHFGIKKEMLAYYEHNKNTKGNLIIKRLCKRFGSKIACRIFKYILSFCLAEHISVTYKSFLKVTTASYNIVFALNFKRNSFRNGTHNLSYRFR